MKISTHGSIRFFRLYSSIEVLFWFANIVKHIALKLIKNEVRNIRKKTVLLRLLVCPELAMSRDSVE